jgi:hypothetical protein
MIQKQRFVSHKGQMMKRSEALEEIRKILAMNGKDNGMGELEEALLHTVESIGMLPPPDYTETYYSGDEPGGYNPNFWEDE